MTTAIHPRRTLAILTLLAITTFPQAQETNAPTTESPRTQNLRYIVAIEDTANMKRLRTAAADVVSRLFLTGFNEHAQPGDLIGLWLAGETTSTNTFPVIRWDPDQRATVSSQSFRLLAELEGNAKNANLNDLMMNLVIEAGAGARTTVYFIGSGSDPLSGTPFDQRINQIFAQHGQSMRKQRTPIVTVLLADGAQWVAHALTPGDRPPYVPPFPKPKAAPTPTPQAAAAPRTNRPTPLILRGRERMLTVEEIQEKLREAQAVPTNPPPTTP